MGWTTKSATHYTMRGDVDRKAECDGIFNEDSKHGKWEVLKSAMRGSTYYAAVKRTKPDGSSHVFGAVCLTRVDNSDYYNFAYKDMSEDCGPCESKCPISILDLLSPTDNEYTLAWRQRCRENAKDKNSLGKLPIGTQIECVINGQVKRFYKQAPMFQFKTPFWTDGVFYIKKNHIPKDYNVINATA